MRRLISVLVLSLIATPLMAATYESVMVNKLVNEGNIVTESVAVSSSAYKADEIVSFTSNLDKVKIYVEDASNDLYIGPKASSTSLPTDGYVIKTGNDIELEVNGSIYAVSSDTDTTCDVRILKTIRPKE